MRTTALSLLLKTLPPSTSCTDPRSSHKTGPKYDGKYLRSITKELLGNITMNQTLTDVIVPTFDIKRFEPFLFAMDTLVTCHLCFFVFCFKYSLFFVFCFFLITFVFDPCSYI